MRNHISGVTPVRASRHKKLGLHDIISADWEAVFNMNFRTITRANQSFISNCEDIYFVKTVVDLVAARSAGS